MDPFPTPQRLSHLHTPTQSFSDSSSSKLPEATPTKSLTINDKKFKEDSEIVKSRLSDQKFNIRDYPDPLLPREPDNFLPKGVTVEMENRLLQVIGRITSAGIGQ